MIQNEKRLSEGQSCSVATVMKVSYSLRTTGINTQIPTTLPKDSIYKFCVLLTTYNHYYPKEY